MFGAKVQIAAREKGLACEVVMVPFACARYFREMEEAPRKRL